MYMYIYMYIYIYVCIFIYIVQSFLKIICCRFHDLSSKRLLVFKIYFNLVNFRVVYCSILQNKKLFRDIKSFLLTHWSFQLIVKVLRVFD